jgi:gamma-glutamyl phosphate reductase
MADVLEMAQKSRAASLKLQSESTREKNLALASIRKHLTAQRETILAANRVDCQVPRFSTASNLTRAH